MPAMRPLTLPFKLLLDSGAGPIGVHVVVLRAGGLNGETVVLAYTGCWHAVQGSVGFLCLSGSDCAINGPMIPNRNAFSGKATSACVSAGAVLLCLIAVMSVQVHQYVARRTNRRFQRRNLGFMQGQQRAITSSGNFGCTALPRVFLRLPIPSAVPRPRGRAVHRRAIDR